MIEKNSKGIVLLCDENNVIKDILHNNMAIEPEDLKDKLFSSIVDRHNITKALTFLMTLKEHKSAYDWEINISTNDNSLTLTFAGAYYDDKYIIIGAENNQECMVLFEELMNMHNQQINIIREVTKEQTNSKVTLAANNIHIDELTLLNNELINTQRELTKKNIALEKSNELTNKLLGMAAHDMRTPLGAIKNMAEFMLMHNPEKLDDSGKKFIKMIEDSSKFMLSLIDDLLDITAIESGKVKITKEKIDIIPIIQDAINIQQIIANKKNIEIHFKTTYHSNILNLDTYKILQVLNNLLSNAIKFSDHHTEIIVSHKKENNKTIISVVDEGPGIDEEYIKKIFDPFTKGKAKPTDGEQSFGLGLAICKKIITSHGGAIDVKSDPGNGSIFSIIL